MELYRFGSSILEKCPFFKYKIELSKVPEGSNEQCYIGETNLGSRYFHGRYRFDEFTKTSLGTIHRFVRLIGAPEEWLNENFYEKIKEK